MQSLADAGDKTIQDDRRLTMQGEASIQRCLSGFISTLLTS